MSRYCYFFFHQTSCTYSRSDRESTTSPPLPDALLLRVFLFSRGDPMEFVSRITDAYASKSTVIYISGVSQRWRRAALAYPLLWQSVAFSTASDSSMECATTFLKLSGGSPLFLFVSGSFPLASRKPRPVSVIARNLFQSISVNVSRLFVCNLLAPPLELRRTWTGHAPNLRHLSIQGDGQDLGHSMGFGDVPNLETLWLADCGIPSFVCPQNLTVLDLGNYHSSRGFSSLHRFLQTLEGVPRIRHLTLRRFYDLSVAMPPPRLVVLSQLRTLELEFCDTHLILTHLYVPPTASTTISHDRFSPADSIISCFPQSKGRSCLLSGSRYIDVTLFAADEEYSLSVTTQSGSRTLLRTRVLGFMREETWLLQSLDALCSFPSLSSVWSLGLRTDVQRIPWLNMLSQLPGLSHLDVRCTDWISLFNALMARNLDKTQQIHSRVRTISLDIDPACNSVSYAHLKACVDYLIHLEPPLERIALATQAWEHVRRDDPSWDALVHSLGTPPLSHEKKKTKSKRRTVTVGRKVMIRLNVVDAAATQ